MTGLSYDYRFASNQLGDKFRTVFKFGTEESVGTDVEDVWTAGGIYPWLTSAQTLYVVSDSLNDAAAGTGARTVTLEGLDADFNEISETLTMNGTSNSAATSQSFLRVHRAYVVTAGSTGSNAGTIDIKDSGAGTTRAQIQFSDAGIGLGQTQMAVYTIPANYRAHLLRGTVSIESTKTCDFFFFQRNLMGSGLEPWRLVENALGIAGPGAFDMLGAVQLMEKTDLRVAVKSAAANTRVQASFALLLERM